MSDTNGKPKFTSVFKCNELWAFVSGLFIGNLITILMGWRSAYLNFGLLIVLLIYGIVRDARAKQRDRIEKVFAPFLAQRERQCVLTALLASGITELSPKELKSFWKLVPWDPVDGMLPRNDIVPFFKSIQSRRWVGISDCGTWQGLHEKQIVSLMFRWDIATQLRHKK